MAEDVTQRSALSWDRHSIKAEVHRRGSTLKAVAVAAGLEQSACRVALSRHHSGGEEAIARFLGVGVSELWPDRASATRASRQRAPWNASRKRLAR